MNSMTFLFRGRMKEEWWSKTELTVKQSSFTSFIEKRERWWWKHVLEWLTVRSTFSSTIDGVVIVLSLVLLFRGLFNFIDNPLSTSKERLIIECLLAVV